MLPGLTEIILLVLIALCIFGLGRLGDISRAIGQMRAEQRQKVAGDEAIDITPREGREAGDAGEGPRAADGAVSDKSAPDEPRQ